MGYFQWIMRYFRVWWPILLGYVCLALEFGFRAQSTDNCGFHGVGVLGRNERAVTLKTLPSFWSASSTSREDKPAAST